MTKAGTKMLRFAIYLWASTSLRGARKAMVRSHELLQHMHDKLDRPRRFAAFLKRGCLSIEDKVAVERRLRPPSNA